MPAPYLIALTTTLVLLLSMPGFAHTSAELCDTREDIAAQCADAHDCITRAEVSEFIGYCKGSGETIMFAMCDQRRGDEDCATGDRCLIGTVDPHIGVCVTNTSPDASMEPPDEADDVNEPACQSVSTRAPAGERAWWLCMLVGALGWRRARRTS